MVKQEEPDTELTDERLEFDHVMYNVLRLRKDSDLVQALVENGLDTMNLVLSCRDELLQNLKVLDKDAGGRLPKYKTIPPGSLVYVENLKRFYVFYYYAKGEPVDWFRVTREQFFRVWKKGDETDLNKEPVSIHKDTTPSLHDAPSPTASGINTAGQEEPDEQAEFDHVMYNVLRLNENSDLVQALIRGGLTTMDLILSCRDKFLQALQVIDKDRTPKGPKYKTISPGSAGLCG